ncbi:hypothetical protein OCO_11620 [Mycobacterium intracellulare MOTT-02]|nr:hypothetical protein OCO_11620 [Mycobacterium intracellulare MOTT-02]
MKPATVTTAAPASSAANSLAGHEVRPRSREACGTRRTNPGQEPGGRRGQ